MTTAIYEEHDGLFVASGHARGPWDPQAQHGGAPAALLAREIERVEPGSGMIVARVTYEFLGPVPLTPLTADAWVQRPGRRFQLIEGELRAGSRSCVREPSACAAVRSSCPRRRPSARRCRARARRSP